MRHTSSKTIPLFNPVVLFVLVSLVVWVSCKKKPAYDCTAASFDKYYNALPELKKIPADKPVRLDVIYAVDADLPALSQHELQQVFTRTSALAAELLGYQVSFRLIKTLPLYRYLESRSSAWTTPPFCYVVNDWYLDPHGSDRFNKSLAAVKAAISKFDDKTLLNYFGHPENKKKIADREAYARHVTTQFLEKMDSLLTENDLNDQPVYSHNRRYSFSFAHWDAIAYSETEADLVVYNGMLAGPDTGMPLYVINRGGITSGFVENNTHRPYQGVGILPLYPFLSNGPAFEKLRGKFTLEQKIESLATMWVHELGHLLKRKKENYTLQGSVHRAPVTLDYYRWASEVQQKHKGINKAIGELKKF